MHDVFTRAHGHSIRWLLALQLVTLFVALPLGARTPAGLLLAAACRLAFAGVCIRVFTRHTGVRVLLTAVLVAVLVLPPAAGTLVGGWNLVLQQELITWTVALFNLLVTVLVARHVFSPGRVRADRVLGAILVYLNVAMLFSNFFGVVELLLPGALHGLSPLAGATDPDPRGAELVYFSFSTITTSSFGDVLPVHPLARSLASLESVVGQLYPPTVLARLVGLHLAHSHADRADVAERAERINGVHDAHGTDHGRAERVSGYTSEHGAPHRASPSAPAEADADRAGGPGGASR